MIDLSKLWEHQKTTYEFGKDKLAVLDASDPGIGKTLAHIKLAEYHLEQGGSRIVVTCPKTLVRSAWLREVSEHAGGMKIALAEAPEATRLAAFESKANLVVLNVDGLKWLEDQPKRWLKKHLGPRAMLINDESHLLKNPEALRTKAALKLAPMFERRHCLSGTMAPNSVVELWTQTKLVDDGKRLGTRFTAFRNLMQYPVMKGPRVEWTDKSDSRNMVYLLLQDIMIRHNFDDVMKNVPDMEHRVMWYEPTKAHKKLYDQLEMQSYLETKDKTITAVNAATLANKLLQVASGAVYNDVDNEERSWTVVDKGRYELIGELVAGRQHSLVFFLWRHQRLLLEEEFKKRKISYAIIDGTVKKGSDREKIINDYQDGKYDTLLLHPKSTEHGITLTLASSVILASPVYEASSLKQMGARIRRGTQNKLTEFITILAEGTRDEQAYDVMSGKKDRLEALNTLFEGRV